MNHVPPVINLNIWIAEHEHLLKPPVNNRVVHKLTKDFIVQVVGGPNQRTDYHVDPYEEWFYQLRGTAFVDVMDVDGPERVQIGAGDMWMLPRLLPHSPQRPGENSIGLVVERVREEGVLERFQWYCDTCHSLVHEVELQVRDIVADLPPVFESFYKDLSARTCKQCGELHKGRG